MGHGIQTKPTKRVAPGPMAELRLGKATLADPGAGPKAASKEDGPAATDPAAADAATVTTAAPVENANAHADAITTAEPDTATEQAESPEVSSEAAIAASHSLASESAAIQFPLCDAAMRKSEGCEWELADAILAECSEPGDDGVRNGSQAKIETMREEIAKNHAVELSLVRVSKLRKVASAFPPDRRRPAVSVEGHLEAGTPEVLDGLIEKAPKGTALTRAYIRELKHPDEKAEQDKQREERGRQAKDDRKALQDVCRNLEQQIEQLTQRNAELCRTNGIEPEPLSPPLAPEGQPSLNVTEDLELGLRGLLRSRGFDPAVDNIKQAMADFVQAVLAQRQ